MSKSSFNLAELITPVLIEIIKVTRAYREHDSWEETMVALNNGDCVWVAMLTTWVIKHKYSVILNMEASDHHAFIVHDGKVFDTLYFRGKEVLTLPFYGTEPENRETKELQPYFYLYAWDEDVKIIVTKICADMGVPMYPLQGHDFGPQPWVGICFTPEELEVLNQFEPDVEFMIRNNQEEDNINVISVKNLNQTV